MSVSLCRFSFLSRAPLPPPSPCHPLVHPCPSPLHGHTHMGECLHYPVIHPCTVAHAEFRVCVKQFGLRGRPKNWAQTLPGFTGGEQTVGRGPRGPGGQILAAFVYKSELVKNVMNQTLMESESNNMLQSGIDFMINRLYAAGSTPGP